MENFEQSSLKSARLRKVVAKGASSVLGSTLCAMSFLVYMKEEETMPSA